MILAAVGTCVAADKKFTLVIDAGHGGNDVGAPGKISYEKNINLKVALAFGKYVERNCPDVRVIYTRTTDVFIPLKERANIANKNKADLFISVHTNALDGGKISRGFETYTLGMHRAAENLNVAQRENSVILIEKNYKQSYAGFDPKSAESYIMFELMQDKNMSNSVELAKMIQSEVCAISGRVNKGVHQAGFLVLRETSMPSCLIELGFITTADEEQFLNTPEGQDKMARGIYNAFLKYKKKYGHGKVSAQNESEEQETNSDFDETMPLLASASDHLVSEVQEMPSASDAEFSEQRAVRKVMTASSMPPAVETPSQPVFPSQPDEAPPALVSKVEKLDNPPPVTQPSAPAQDKKPQSVLPPKNNTPVAPVSSATSTSSGQPTSTPSVAKPTESPSSQDSSSSPTSRSSAPSNTKSTTTPSNPIPNSAAVTPAKEQPTATPAKEQPTATPAKEQPAATPAKEQPAAAPAKEQPTSTPAKEQPATAPAKEQPAATPAKGQPAAAPAKEQPAAAPAKEQPAATPAKEQPAATPAKEQPAAAPAKEQPKKSSDRQVATADTAPQPSAPALADQIVFKVQIAASSQQIPVTSSFFQGLEGVECYSENGMVKYTVGSSPDYEETVRLRKTISASFPQAFIVAFRNGEKMDMPQAMKEYRNRKK